ncbi:unnamed protein product [Candidula unifasciata]|uniref:EGF-like domain-containing protein n=1 Tax=Candidula unifasciata TaxID=100452 RepID=A0A8S3ZQC1_9EUPU|nr:unnamed protein product [Candidula unifasciata]
MSNFSSFTLFYYICCTFILCAVIQGIDSGDSKKVKKNEERKPLSSICNTTCSKDINTTKTGNFCRSVSTTKLYGRCCYNTTDTTILGIDLENCNMTREKFSAGIKNINNLRYISLQGNDHLKQVKGEDFHRNTNIEYLSLPLGMACPGNLDFWNSNTTDKDATICQGELDPCLVHNVTCPENSHCVHSGVGLTECLCNVGYHGYKCMNQGTFPTIPFVLGIAIPTVVICALLWVTQRRYVRPSNKNK